MDIWINGYMPNKQRNSILFNRPENSFFNINIAIKSKFSLIMKQVVNLIKNILATHLWGFVAAATTTI